MSKFCASCGQKLPDQANFCTHCGQKQAPMAAISAAAAPNQSVTSQVDDQRQSQPVSAPTATNLQAEVSQSAANQSATDIGLGLLTKGVVDVGPLMKTDNVVQQKVKLGYSDDATNFVYTATPLDWNQILTVSGLTGMASQNYVLCFESTGILLMGCIGLAKFNDDNHFIPNEDISKIDLEKASLGAEWDHMYLEVKGEVLELLVQHPASSVTKWHRQNFKKNLTYTV